MEKSANISITVGTPLLLDPWSVDYDASVQTQEDGASASTVRVDAAVETSDWKARRPGLAVDSAAFVDGVRRVEARVLAMRPDGLVYGVFASFAVGTAIVSEETASFSECQAFRRFLLSSGLVRSEGLVVGNANLQFEGRSVPANSPAELVLALQNAMREAEWLLARRLASPIIFLDGPLAFVTEPPGPVVGLVKSIHRLYLDPAHMELVSALRAGERTPVFTIEEGRKTRYSWYLRIAEPRSTQHTFSGVIRLEAAAVCGLDAAIQLAGFSAALLPRLASSSHRDGRAPQNLIPVGALEDHLRNWLGDATLIQRAIERRISEGIAI